jgi:hypothetical protein
MIDGSRPPWHTGGRRRSEGENIGELVANVSEQEIFIMPDVRIIGKAYRCTFEADKAGESPHQDHWR